MDAFAPALDVWAGWARVDAGPFLKHRENITRHTPRRDPNGPEPIARCELEQIATRRRASCTKAARVSGFGRDGAGHGFALSGTSFGVDFDPVNDALRVVSNTGQNLRIASGGAGAANVDAPLNVGTVPAAGVVSAAYSNAFAGAASTTLYVLQDNPAAATDALFIQNPPDGGLLTSPVTLTVNVSQLSGFDVTPGDRAFLSWNGGNQFGTLNLVTGQAVNSGAIGGGFAGQIAGIAVAVPEPAPLATAGLAAACVLGRRRRR